MSHWWRANLDASANIEISMLLFRANKYSFQYFSHSIIYPPLSSKPFISVPRLEEQEITKPGGGEEALTIAFTSELGIQW